MFVGYLFMVVGIAATALAAYGAINFLSQFANATDMVKTAADNVVTFLKSIPGLVTGFIQSSFYIVPSYVMVPLICIISIAFFVLIVRLFVKFVNTITFRS